MLMLLISMLALWGGAPIAPPSATVQTAKKPSIKKPMKRVPSKAKPKIVVKAPSVPAKVPTPNPVQHPKSDIQNPIVPGLPLRPASEAKKVAQYNARPGLPIRLGGLYTLGLGAKSDTFEDSASRQTLISDENLDWIAANCDVVALNAVNITPDTFRELARRSFLLTPLLHLYASTLYEQPYVKGNVGGWRPAMTAWTLRNNKGQETRHPDNGGHWMDFANIDWAQHWRDSALNWAREYGAQGVLASELPPGNRFIEGNLAKYKTLGDRTKAAATWLKAAKLPGGFLTIPSALGFDTLVGRPTLPTPPGTVEPELPGRVWDEVFPAIDGAWAEGWLNPYWGDEPLPETLWEVELEAADRASRNGQVFIAAAAYRNDTELEYLLASYLLVWHRQGRLVLQPMPVREGQEPDAGYSLAVARREVKEKSRFFDVPLGVGMQERAPIPVEGGLVWRRPFQFGIVYVNSSDSKTVHIALGSELKRCNGSLVREFDLPPHSGAILQYTQTASAKTP